MLSTIVSTCSRAFVCAALLGACAGPPVAEDRNVVLSIDLDRNATADGAPSTWSLESIGGDFAVCRGGDCISSDVDRDDVVDLDMAREALIALAQMSGTDAWERDDASWWACAAKGTAAMIVLGLAVITTYKLTIRERATAVAGINRVLFHPYHAPFLNQASTFQTHLWNHFERSVASANPRASRALVNRAYSVFKTTIEGLGVQPNYRLDDALRARQVRVARTADGVTLGFDDGEVFIPAAWDDIAKHLGDFQDDVESLAQSARVPDLDANHIRTLWKSVALHVEALLAFAVAAWCA